MGDSGDNVTTTEDGLGADESGGDRHGESALANDHAITRILDSGADLVPEGDLPDKPTDLTSKAAKGFLWALVGFIVLQLGGFATYAVAANYLGPEDLGIVGKVLTVVFWMDVLLDMGMGASVIHDQERGQTERVRVAFTVNTIVAVVVSGGLLLAAPAIASYFRIPESVALFRLLALLALIRGLAQVPDSLLRRDMEFRQRSFSSFVRSILRFGVAVTLLELGWGPAAMVVSVVVSEISGAIVTVIQARFVPRFRFDLKLAVELFKYGMAVFGSRLVGMLWLNGDYLVIGARSTNREYGSYFTAFRLPELVLGSVYNIFSSVAFPTYSAARAAGPEKLREAALKSLRLLCLFGFPAGVGLALIARDFITVMFPGIPGAVVPMQLLSLAGCFVGVGYASGDLFNAIGKPRLGLYFNLLGAPILIGGFLLVVDRGIAAVALVHLVVIVPYSAFRIEVANRLVGTTWRQSLAAMRPGTVAVLGMVALALPVRLLMPAGFVSGLAVVAAGALGAGLGLVLGDRSAYSELRDLAMKATSR